MTAPLRSTILAALVLAPATAVAASSGQLAARTPQLTADPVAVQPGGTLTLEGSGFPGNVHVALMAKPPHGATTRIGGAETGRHGHFLATIHIRPQSSAGAFVALACHDDCRLKASARFRIVDR
ncbi:MAG TPA: hypothetical protein VFG31_05855 [Conexibacter sp.]|nr:hypothetical protein [Conexibacter sp.]